MISDKRRSSSLQLAQRRHQGQRVGLMREIIARRAYHIWQSRGCPEGTAAEDWRQAEMEMRQANVFRTGRRGST